MAPTFPLPQKTFRGNAGLANGELVDILNNLKTQIDAVTPPTVTGLHKIYQDSDWPAAVGDFIPLVDNDVYELMNPTTISAKGFTGAGITFRGNATPQATVSSTYAGALFTTSGPGAFVCNGVSLVNFVGSIFDLAPGTGAFDAVSFSNSFFLGHTIGELGDCGLVTLNNSFFIGFQQGWSITGTIPGGFSSITSQYTSAAGSPDYIGINFTDTCVTTGASVPANTFNLGHADHFGIRVHPSATITPGHVRISGAQVPGLGMLLDDTGKDKTDIDILSFGNDGSEDDSHFIGAYSLSGNTEATILTMNTTAVVGKDNGSHPRLVFDAGSERFVKVGTSAETDALQYIGKVTRDFNVAVGLTVDKGGGGAQNIGVGIQKNATPIAASELLTEVASAAQFAPSKAIVTMATGDTIQATMVNRTGSTDIVAKSIRVDITRVV